MKLGSHHSQETKDKISKSNPRKKGKDAYAWKGGKILIGGYFYIHSPDHPCKTKQDYMCEHRLVMERKLGRYLLPVEIVHHINGVITDNRLKNLILLKNKSEHRKSHPEISANQKIKFKGKHFSPETEFKKKK